MKMEKRVADGQFPNLDYMAQTQKTTGCPLCGSSAQSLVSSGVSRGGISLSYVICHFCTHIYMRDVPSRDSYLRFYESGDYRRLTSKYKISSKMARDAALYERRYAHGVRLYNQYFSGILKRHDFVFDFGCGDGAWLYGLNKMTGCAVDGNEPSEEDAALIKNKLGADIFVGLVEDCYDDVLALYKGRIKLAIVSGSLQHMLDPMKCLRLAHEILQDDGYLYVCNKNIFVHYVSTQSPYPRYFSDLRTVDHPHYFHEGSYRYMLESAGFRIREFTNDSKVRVAHMEALAQKESNKQTIPPLLDYREILSQLIQNEKEVSDFKSFSARVNRWIKQCLSLN